MGVETVIIGSALAATAGGVAYTKHEKNEAKKEARRANDKIVNKMQKSKNKMSLMLKEQNKIKR